MDLITLIVALIIAVALNALLLYFVVKSAIKNALIEDRAFQAKVTKMQRARTAEPAHLSADGA